MPGRRDIFHVYGIYHIFNRTIDKRSIFHDIKLAQLFLDTLYYYRSHRATISFSQFRHQIPEVRLGIEKEIAQKTYYKIDILAFCLMPTHFHLIVQELQANGTVTFMSNTANSLTRYYNLKQKRKGPLFLPRFQSREIVTDEQLEHVSRYLHLNPFSSGLVKKIDDLIEYHWSSYRYYLTQDRSQLVNPGPIMDLFGGDLGKYKSFVDDRADYQRSLEYLKYINQWNS